MINYILIITNKIGRTYSGLNSLLLTIQKIGGSFHTTHNSRQMIIEAKIVEVQNL